MIRGIQFVDLISAVDLHLSQGVHGAKQLVSELFYLKRVISTFHLNSYNN